MVSKYEIKAQKELEALGFRVDNKRGASRWTKNRDFWNLFDLCCISPDKKFIHWISIKGKAGIPGAHLKEIKDFILPPNNIKEIWGKSTGKDKTKYWHKIII